MDITIYCGDLSRNNCASPQIDFIDDEPIEGCFVSIAAHDLRIFGYSVDSPYDQRILVLEDNGCFWGLQSLGNGIVRMYHNLTDRFFDYTFDHKFGVIVPGDQPLPLTVAQLFGHR